MHNVVLIIHNIRSSHNVGAMLRTAEGLGVTAVYLTGYTPYPQHRNDQRLPHEARKVTKQIQKTALDAHKYQTWFREESVNNVIHRLKKLDFTVAALEQAKDSQLLNDYKPQRHIAIIVGREVEGVEPEVLSQCDLTLEIPMYGEKESYNVASAAAMALYHLRLFQ